MRQWLTTAATGGTQADLLAPFLSQRQSHYPDHARFHRPFVPKSVPARSDVTRLVRITQFPMFPILLAPVAATSRFKIVMCEVDAIILKRDIGDLSPRLWRPRLLASIWPKHWGGTYPLASRSLPGGRTAGRRAQAALRAGMTRPTSHMAVNSSTRSAPRPRQMDRTCWRSGCQGCSPGSSRRNRPARRCTFRRPR